VDLSQYTTSRLERKTIKSNLSFTSFAFNVYHINYFYNDLMYIYSDLLDNYGIFRDIVFVIDYLDCATTEGS